MNKKLTMMGVSMAVGATMLVTTAYAGMSGTSGYDTYKTAFKNTLNAKSLTSDVNVSVTDNGNKLVDMNATMKMNHETKAMSKTTTIDAGNQQKTMDEYEQNGQTIKKSSDSDVYKVFAFDGQGKHKDKKWNQGAEAGRISEVENVIDALTGNIQNNITLQSESDGSNDVALKLSNDQISPVVNAIAPIVVKQNTDQNTDRKESSDPFETNLKASLPKLVDNIKVNTVDLSAKLSKDNVIQHQTANVEITGNDANGKAHDVMITVNADFSNYGSTTPDTVDLNGKHVQTIQSKDLRGHDEQE